MDLEILLKNADPNIIIFLLTTLIAFISWLIKSLVEAPLKESKATFNKFFDKRLEILTEIKTRLNLIAYFPTGKEALEYKNQLQSIYLKDGKTGYLSKEIYDNVLLIPISPNTNENLLLSTIKKIDEELYTKISKVQSEIHFYRKFSNYNPLEKFLGLMLLTLQYIISFVLIGASLFFIGQIFIEGSTYIRIATIVVGIFLLWMANNWLKK